MKRPGDLLLQRERGIQPEPFVVRVQIDPRCASDDVGAPLGRAEDEVRRAGRGPLPRWGQPVGREGGEAVGEDV